MRNESPDEQLSNFAITQDVYTEMKGLADENRQLCKSLDEIKRFMEQHYADPCADKRCTHHSCQIMRICDRSMGATK